jgi:hypothetical protein
MTILNSEILTQSSTSAEELPTSAMKRGRRRRNLPLGVLYIFGQRFFVRGLTAGMGK